MLGDKYLIHEKIIKRNHNWANLFEKYETLSQFDSRDIACDDVDSIDFCNSDDKKPQCLESNNNNSKARKNNHDQRVKQETLLKDDERYLMYMIDVELNSNLKVYLQNRNEYMYAKNDSYNYWDQKVKTEIMRLCKNVSKTSIRKYIALYESDSAEFKCQDIDTVHDFNLNDTKKQSPEKTLNKVKKSNTDQKVVAETADGENEKSLIHTIEVELNSNLKVYLQNRIESIYLDNGSYHYWNHKAKTETKRLYEHISKESVHKYIGLYHGEMPLDEILKAMNDGDFTRLTEYLIRKERLNDREEEYRKVCKLLIEEWNELLYKYDKETLLFYIVLTKPFIIQCIAEKTEKKFIIH